MNRMTFERSSSNQRVSAWLDQVVLQVLCEIARKSEIRSEAIASALAAEYERLVRVTQPCRRLDQRVEHGLQIEGRAADDLEHIGGSGLLLERFGEVVSALAQLVEQARILDGDDGLRSEVLHQLDLLVGERSNVLVEYPDPTHQPLVLDHRHDQQGADAAEVNPGDGQRIAIEIGSIGAIVGDVDDIERFDDAGQRVQRTRLM